jgi:hypothetical protein
MNERSAPNGSPNRGRLALICQGNPSRKASKVVHTVAHGGRHRGVAASSSTFATARIRPYGLEQLPQQHPAKIQLC